MDKLYLISPVHVHQELILGWGKTGQIYKEGEYFVKKNRPQAVTVQLRGVKEGNEVRNPMELGFGGKSRLC